jgi:hypothetical protein
MNVRVFVTSELNIFTSPDSIQTKLFAAASEWKAACTGRERRVD